MRGPMLRYLLAMIRGYVSADGILRRAEILYESDRRQTYAACQETAAFCVEELTAAGVSHVEILRYPADERTMYGDFLAPLAWDVEDARLEIVSPETSEPLLCSYKDDPYCLTLYSAPTPSEGVEANLAVVDDPASESALRAAAGKIVLTRSRAFDVERAAAEAGAVGIVTDAMRAEPFRRAEDLEEFADARQSEHMQVVARDQRQADPDNPQARCFGFVLTPDQGKRLREMLRAQPDGVRLRATVRATLREAEVLVPTGVLPGSELPDEEIMLIAHTGRPHAHDNAVAAAALIEIIAGLQRAIEEGEVAAPRRSIRLLFGDEYLAPMAFVFHPHLRTSRVVSALHLDNLGADHQLRNTCLTLRRNPDANASFTDTLLLRIFQQHVPSSDGGFRWRSGPFMDSAAIIADPMIGVTCPALGEHPEKYHHTNLDTLDGLDLEGLTHAGEALVIYTLLLADADLSLGRWLGAEIFADASGVLDAIAERREFPVRPGRPGQPLGSDGEMAEALDYALVRGTAALTSLLPCVSGDAQVGLQRVLDPLCERLAAHRAERGPASARPPKPKGAIEKEAAILVPRRLLPGVPSPRTRLGEMLKTTTADEEYARHVSIHALFWCDGKRSLFEIGRLVRLELGLEILDYDRFLDVFGFLQDKGFVELQDDAM